jgi:hypothetical protein
MNIWAMRNRLKSVTAGGPQRPQPVEAPKPAPQLAPPPVSEEEDVVITHIGLDSLFELNESQLRKFSPSCSFSKLKNPQPPSALPVVEMLRPSVGLNDLLTMDSEQVERLYS